MEWVGELRPGWGAEVDLSLDLMGSLGREIWTGGGKKEELEGGLEVFEGEAVDRGIGWKGARSAAGAVQGWEGGERGVAWGLRLRA